MKKPLAALAALAVTGMASDDAHASNMVGYFLPVMLFGEVPSVRNKYRTTLGDASHDRYNGGLSA